MPYGKFGSFEAFLTSYTKAQRAEEVAADVTLESARARARRRKERDVVEIKAAVSTYLGTENDAASHQHVKVLVTEAVDLDPDVAADVNRVQTKQEPVFVSIRFGDRAGIEEALPEDEVDEGSSLHLRGEWIPKDKAYAHGGELMSVLHFTHQPLGFVCSDTKCYS